MANIATKVRSLPTSHTSRRDDNETVTAVAQQIAHIRLLWLEGLGCDDRVRPIFRRIDAVRDHFNRWVTQWQQDDMLLDPLRNAEIQRRADQGILREVSLNLIPISKMKPLEEDFSATSILCRLLREVEALLNQLMPNSDFMQLSQPSGSFTGGPVSEEPINRAESDDSHATSTSVTTLTSLGQRHPSPSHFGIYSPLLKTTKGYAHAGSNFANVADAAASSRRIFVGETQASGGFTHLGDNYGYKVSPYQQIQQSVAEERTELPDPVQRDSEQSTGTPPPWQRGRNQKKWTIDE